MELQRVGDKESSLSEARRFKEEHPDSKKYWCCKVCTKFLIFLIIVILIIVGCGYILWYLPYIVTVLALILILFFPLKSCIHFGSSCSYYKTTIKDMKLYQNETLMNECCEKVSKHWNIENDIQDQLIEGYCAFGSMNSVLSSVYNQRLYLAYPKKAKPLTFRQMAETLTTHIIKDESVENDFPEIKIVSIEAVEMNPDTISIDKFENMIKQTYKYEKDDGDVDGDYQYFVYYIANFNRVPLFFCNIGWFKRWLTWIYSGHFSPIISYCYDDNNIMYILIGDVNQAKYGNYLVRSDRLYESMKCKEATGNRRGLVRIVVKKKLHV